MITFKYPIKKGTNKSLLSFLKNFEENITEKRFSCFSSIYPFATENICGYFEYARGIDSTAKNVVTVCASGDHIINALMKGAKKLICFDINILAFYYVELKLAALKKFDYNTFKSFFFYFDNEDKDINKKAFNYNDFSKIKSLISSEAQNFFESIYSIYNKDGEAVKKSPLFRNENTKNKFFINNNFYLDSEKNYLIAKDSLANLEELIGLICDIKDLNKNLGEINLLPKTIDMIIFSDIANYAELMFGNNDALGKFYNHCVNKNEKYLSNKGIFYIAYVYNFKFLSSFTKGYKPYINYKTKRAKAFKKSVFSYHEFEFNGVSTSQNDILCILHA